MFLFSDRKLILMLGNFSAPPPPSPEVNPNAQNEYVVSGGIA